MKKLKLILLLPSLIFIGCSEDPISDQIDNENETQSQITTPSDDITEIAFPNEKGSVTDVYYTGIKMPVESVNGQYVFEGDIIIPKSKATKSPVKLVYEKGETPPQKSVGRTSHYWPDNTVYYDIDGSLSNTDRVYDAINHWESKTNIEFVKRSGQSNYIYFTPGSGCSSYVGMVGGRQNITLADACSTGNTIHEIGHAMGLWHEQSRVDRDNHITIHFENIQSGREYNFETYAENNYDGKEFTTNLDFGSIMMYSPYAFSRNGQPTITKRDGSTYGVQRSALSSGDVQGINSMYPADGGGGTSTYINGEYYTIQGLRVLRNWDRWFYNSTIGWMQVELVDGRWRYVF
ncbi:M12 family metallopeptidase [Christiangramia sediminis]|uniref:M12 family metallopeptidase n=1 Tax=Christiangramia sediminis TaxID=2881336 RepID=A0A9X1LHZ4_9FLAO|nr:M12 family metallopeptidase [Christiangramia sediminis]MCB7480653.1 M12 family metallopeptidase [Christiangramia sediminis]